MIAASGSSAPMLLLTIAASRSRMIAASRSAPLLLLTTIAASRSVLIAASGSAPLLFLTMIAALRGCRSTPKARLLSVRRLARAATAKAILLPLLLPQVPPTLLAQVYATAAASTLLQRHPAT